MTPFMKIETEVIHAGETRPGIFGAVAFPIFQSATYEYPGETPDTPLRYARLNNTPNHELLSKKLAALEKAESALVTSSGMAAITTSLLALLGEGEELLAQDNLYGGTAQFLKEDFPKFGRSVRYFSIPEEPDLSQLVTKNTRAIYVESVSNPLMQIPNFTEVVRVAKAHSLLTIIDNTFPSPYNFNPIQHGFDLVVHSATKYLNGHSDLVAGAIMGKLTLVSQVSSLLKLLGASLDPHGCFLLTRGLKTLAVRVRAQNATAQILAEALSKHSRVKSIFYPGLQNFHFHNRAREYFLGFGGMLSFEHNGNVEETDRFIKRLKIPYIAPSLGGPETLVTRPVLTSHSWLDPESRRACGISDNLVRVSVGLEAAEDLVDDFINALEIL